MGLTGQEIFKLLPKTNVVVRNQGKAGGTI